MRVNFFSWEDLQFYFLRHQLLKRGLSKSKLNYPNVDNSKKGVKKKAAAQQLIQSAGGLAGPQRSEKQLRAKAKFDNRRKVR